MWLRPREAQHGHVVETCESEVNPWHVGKRHLLQAGIIKVSLMSHFNQNLLAGR
jgi:hypothetical protein